MGLGTGESKKDNSLYPKTKKIFCHKDLRVYKDSLEIAMEIFTITKRFPQEEKYSLTDQVRRSSRSVCANLSEAWRKRRYKAAFIAKLNDVETEATETQVWIEIASRCNYITFEEAERLEKFYDRIIGQLIRMIEKSDSWLICKK